MPCREIDEQVARRDPKIAGVLDQFVCVRIVQCWGLDLSLFQFDGQLTWAAMFLNADRTIYGRYGSRSSHDGDEDISVEGFRLAAQGALALHKNYPQNKARLALNTGTKPDWLKPEKIPMLPGKRVIADGTRNGCIHCHAMVTGTIQTRLSRREKINDELLWAYPMPDAVGVHLDVKKKADVQRVRDGSPADKAGFQVGDQIRWLRGTPVNSIADVQWLLHTSKAPAKLPVEVQRDGKTVQLTLSLPKDWRRASDFGWRANSWYVRFKFAGFKSKALTAAQRKQRGLNGKDMALYIERIAPGWVRHRNRAAATIGLRRGDVIVAVDGQTGLRRECDLIAYLVQEKKSGQRARLTILRDGRQRTLMLPMP